MCKALLATPSGGSPSADLGVSQKLIRHFCPTTEGWHTGRVQEYANNPTPPQ